MMTGLVVQDQNLEKQIEKQMGCMAGFFQIFDRHQALTGGHKRLYSNKRLPPSTGNNSIPEAEKSIVTSPVTSREEEKQPPEVQTMPPSPVPETRSPATVTEAQSKLPTLPLPLPVFDGTNKSSWAPRLSLDSRATFDAAKGSLKPREIRTLTTACYDNKGVAGGESDTGDSDTQRRSVSVIARLMGLEQLHGGGGSDPEEKKPELRRSASESRASRDLLHYRFIDGVNFQLKQSSQQQYQQQHKKQSSQQQHQHQAYSNAVRDSATKDKTPITRRLYSDSKEYNVSVRAEQMRRASQGRVIGQRKSFFDSADFFPEPKQSVSSIYGEIGKRLKMRGIDEPSKDLDRQILDALQLKGLLHSNKTPFASDQIGYRNFVYENRIAYSNDESSIVVIKPARSNNNSVASPRREVAERNGRGQARGRSSSSPTRSEGGARSPVRRRGQSNGETRGRGVSGIAADHPRVPPVQSPRVGSRRVGTVPDQTVNRSPRGRRRTVEIYRHTAEDELSTLSESSISTSSHTDTDRSKVEEYKEGRSILERCDKLLHSIAEMTAMATTDLQPSPVSVLDSSFYKEESSPSPVMKRNIIDFKDQLAEFEDDIWSPAFSLKSEENSDDSDYLYISDVLRASNNLREDLEIFQLLEKQQYLKGKDTSEVSRLQRKLTFDTITEILQRKRQLPPWKVITLNNPTSGQSSLQQIWSEFQRIRERDVSDDLFEVICGVLKKDLSRDAINGWEDCPIEMSEVVLDIERLVFKDLISETIRDLATFTGGSAALLPRRKLVF